MDFTESSFGRKLIAFLGALLLLPYSILGTWAVTAVWGLVQEPGLERLLHVFLMLVVQALFFWLAWLACQRAKEKYTFAGMSFGAWVAGFSLAYILGVGLGLLIVSEMP